MASMRYFYHFSGWLRSTLQWSALVFILLVSGAFSSAVAASINPKAHPAEFIEAVADNAINIVKKEQDTIINGDIDTIRAMVNEHVLPYVNMEKTTRLATGRYWRQASAEQRQKLVESFTETLVRTYSSAFTGIDQKTRLQLKPFRGDPEADDVVVRSTLIQGNGQTVDVDYRMENTPDGWKIYDINAEGIWLIQNYRNQFAEQISKNGIDGLIDALNKRHSEP